MGILDKLGLKKKQEDRTGTTELDNQIKSAETPEPSKKTGKKTRFSRAHEILVKPVLSEKATHLATLGKYVFEVHANVNKIEIAKSIREVYDVNVASVRIVNMPGKMRRYGRSVGQTSNWKKAIVTLKKGEKIPGIIEAVG